MPKNEKKSLFTYDRQNEDYFFNKIHNIMTSTSKSGLYFRLIFNFSCTTYKKLFFENRPPKVGRKWGAVPLRNTDFVELNGAPSNNSKINGKICTILATYSADGTIPCRIIHALEEYSKVSDYIIIVGDYKLKNNTEYDKIKKYVNCAYYIRHHQYDVGSWGRAIKYLISTKKLAEFDYLILANDSVYGPIFPLTDLYSKMDSKNTDFWGMSINYDPNKHIQSFFYAFRKTVFNDELFQNIFKNIPATLTWEMAINQYELVITPKLSEKFTYCAAINDLNSVRPMISGNSNPTAWPLDFIQAGAPFIKIKAMNGKFKEELHQSELDVLSYLKDRSPKTYSDILENTPYLKSKNYDASNTGCNPDSISRLLYEVEVVSFDIFDTLLIRPFVKPTDLFEYLSSKYNVPEFSKLRIQAERNARQKKSSKEVTLNEIYLEMDSKYNYLQEIEFETELKLIKPHPKAALYYKEALAASKKIICVSDTYFTLPQIKKLLNKCEYAQISKIYLSSEYGSNKGKTLFNVVINDLKISPEKILHIGDNKISDYESPLKLGLHAVLLNKLTDIFLKKKDINRPFINFYERKDDLKGSVWISMISQNRATMPNSTTFWFDLGYCLGGSFVVGYIMYIAKVAKQNSIDKLFFASRDGYILKKIFDKYFSKKLQIESEYVYISRKVGLLSTLDYEDEPEYLKQLLSEASTEVENIQVYTNHLVNEKIYATRLPDLQKWSKKYKGPFTNHLLNRAGKSTRIAIVDLTSTRMSAYHYTKLILGDRVKIAITSASFKQPLNSSHYVYLSRSLTDLESYETGFLEELITAPEPPICYLDESEKPVYGKSDKNIENTKEILSGISKFVDDYMKDFAEDNLFVNIDEEMWILHEYLSTLTITKRRFLKELNHSPGLNDSTNNVNFGEESTYSKRRNEIQLENTFVILSRAVTCAREIARTREPGLIFLQPDLDTSIPT